MGWGSDEWWGTDSNPGLDIQKGCGARQNICDSFGGTILLSFGERTYAFLWFSEGWECTRVSDNKQMTDNPYLSPNLPWVPWLVAQSTTSSTMLETDWRLGPLPESLRSEPGLGLGAPPGKSAQRGQSCFSKLFPAPAQG